MQLLLTWYTHPEFHIEVFERIIEPSKQMTWLLALHHALNGTTLANDFKKNLR